MTTLLVAFLAFTGVAAMVPGGLVQPADAARPLADAVTCWSSPAGDAIVAFLLGYRVAALA